MRLKKVMAALAAVALCVSSVGGATTAWAVENGGGTPEEEVVSYADLDDSYADLDDKDSYTVDEENKQIVYADYTLEFSVSNGEVTITGIQDIVEDGTIKVTIPETIPYEGSELPVTTIGDNAFKDCNSLTTIDCSSVETIGNWAFYQCTSLKEIDCSSATMIGDWAFLGCTVLTTITLSSSLETIGDYAFEHCGDLSDVYFYGTETEWSDITIGNYNGYLTSAKIHYLTVEDGVTYCTEHNEIFGDGYILKCEYVDETQAKLKITGYSGEPAHVVIPESLGGTPITTIGKRAFYQCASLKTIDCSSVTMIGEAAFCECTALTEIYCPNVTKLGDENGDWGAFEGCTSLTTITCPNVETIGAWAFCDCFSLKSIDCSNVTTIGAWAFYDCLSLKSIDCPNVEAIGEGAFSCCTILQSINCPNVKEIGDYAFEVCTSLESIDCPNVEAIGDEAFEFCVSLTSVTVSNKLTEIGDWAFYSCNALSLVIYDGTEDEWEDITIGENNTSLDNATIRYLQGTNTYENLTFTYNEDGTITITGCTSGDVIIPSEIDGKTVTAIGEGAFANSNATITIPDSVTSIGNDAFGENSSIIYEGSASDWENIFGDTTGVTLIEGDFTYTVDEDGNVTITGCTSDSGSIIIPSEIDGKTVTGIGEGVLDDYSDITYEGSASDWAEIIGEDTTGVTFTEGDLTYIVNGDGVTITGCTSDSIVIPTEIDGKSVTGIGEGVLDDYTDITYEGSASDWENIFGDTTGVTFTEGNLTYIVSGDGVTITGCTSDSAVIPVEIDGKTVTSIASGVLDNCHSVIYEGSASDWSKIIGKYEMGYTEGDFTYTVDANGNVTITGCTSDSGSITIPSEIDGKTVTGIGEGVLDDYSDITYEGSASDWTEIIGEDTTGVTFIEDDFTYTVGEDGNVTITGCTSDDDSIIIPSEIDGKTVTGIGEGVLDDYSDITYEGSASDWTEIIGEDTTGVTFIEDDFTYTVGEDGNVTITGCTSDSGSITIPSEIDGKTVTGIGEGAFADSDATITIPDSVTSIGNDAFGENSSIIYEGSASDWADVDLGKGNDDLDITFTVEETTTITTMMTTTTTKATTTTTVTTTEAATTTEEETTTTTEEITTEGTTTSTVEATTTTTASMTTDLETTTTTAMDTTTVTETEITVTTSTTEPETTTTTTALMSTTTTTEATTEATTTTTELMTTTTEATTTTTELTTTTTESTTESTTEATTESTTEATTEATTESTTEATTEATTIMTTVTTQSTTETPTEPSEELPQTGYSRGYTAAGVAACGLVIIGGICLVMTRKKK